MNKKQTTPLPKIKQGQKLPRDSRGLTVRERLFIDKYIETHNGTQSAIAAGYSEKTAGVKASQLLNQVSVQEEITRRVNKLGSKSIANAQEVMEFLTRVMNGEVKDQFGLDAPLSERTKAAIELAKRTFDIENRNAGKADNVVEVKIDWSRGDE